MRDGASGRKREEQKRIRREKKQSRTIQSGAERGAGEFETGHRRMRNEARKNAGKTRRNEKKQNMTQRKKTESDNAGRDTRQPGIRQDQAIRKEMKRHDTGHREKVRRKLKINGADMRRTPERNKAIRKKAQGGTKRHGTI